MTDNLYTILLRVSVLVCAIVLVFVSGIISPITQELARNAGNYVASSIGMSASVEPTELNTMTAELTSRLRDLDVRERALQEREIAVNLNQGRSSDISTFVISSILFILLVLVVLNYVLDYLRAQAIQNRPLTYEQVQH